MTISEDNDAR